MSAPSGEPCSRPVPTLRGRQVTLRPPEARDVDAARRLGRSPEIVRLFGEEPEDAWRELSQKEAEDLVAALHPSPERVDWVVDGGRGFVGTAALHSFDEESRSAAYAVGLLSPALLGRGLGTEVTRLVLAYAFGELSLETLTVRVLECNARAIACYARCGFDLLRREPDAVMLDGVSHADLIMGLEAPRYRALVETWAGAGRPAS